MKSNKMIKIKNRTQLIILGFEESWAGVFSEHVLPILPVKQILELYSHNYGRPTKELYSVVGTVILQQFFNISELSSNRLLENLG